MDHCCTQLNYSSTLFWLDVTCIHKDHVGTMCTTSERFKKLDVDVELRVGYTKCGMVPEVQQTHRS